MREAVREAVLRDGKSYKKLNPVDETNASRRNPISNKVWRDLL